MNKKKPQPTSAQPAAKSPKNKPSSGKSASGSAASSKPSGSAKGATFKSVAENRKAKHNYEILDSVECGMVLHGSEVKSLRNGRCSIEEAYARFKDGELWLVDCEIDEYRQATFWNHPTKRMRKLLLHRRELHRFGLKAKERGLTLIPLRVYFTDRSIAKCVIALCKGRKLHDKREVLKKADARREIDRAIKQRTKRL
ncbi:MAG: SsrA-binding protein SmpB [Planctomycetaceae bacterium]|nr:SsrA-binding protein SmpB [Planctomycetaceae bacterium]